MYACFKFKGNFAIGHNFLEVLRATEVMCHTVVCSLLCRDK